MDITTSEVVTTLARLMNRNTSPLSEEEREACWIAHIVCTHQWDYVEQIINNQIERRRE